MAPGASNSGCVVAVVVRICQVVEWIAHRAGNVVATIDAAVASADAIELDVHLFRRRLEVRHGKVLWPFGRLWERWELLPQDSPRPALAEIVAAAPPGTHLWLDLKGFTPGLTERVLAATGDRRPLTVSTRNWWILRPARRRSGIRTMRSVGNRLQRWLITRSQFGTDDGIVMHERLIDPDTVPRLLARTSTLVCWGVTTRERAAELGKLGVTGVIVDDLDLIREGRAGAPPR